MSWSSEISKAVLTVYANGVYDEASNEAAVSFFLGEREYSDCDSNELLPTRLEPFDDLLAGYWVSHLLCTARGLTIPLTRELAILGQAIARALSCTPSPAFLTIYSGNEVCISNLNLSLKNKNSSHKHTHRTLTARILTRIQARVRSGGTVTLKYVDPKSGAEDDCSTNVRKAGT